jgi:hypothetical protein
LLIEGKNELDIDKIIFPNKKSHASRKDELRQKVYSIAISLLYDGVVVPYAKRFHTYAMVFGEYADKKSVLEYLNEGGFEEAIKKGYATKRQVNNILQKFGFDKRYEKGGGIYADEEKKEIYQKWKKLVNMTAAELENFYNSEEGKDAGLKPKEAKDLGIHYGRESARWIIKMKKTPVTEWTPKMWEWAKRQINFNTRMLGNKGGLYDEKGEKTRKHTSLLIWGHNPEKK